MEGSVQDLYAFMHSANATLDSSLEEDSSPQSTARRGSMLVSSIKATPRGLPSAEARAVANLMSPPLCIPATPAC